MTKGLLKVSRTNKGKIIVELDKRNGRAPMPLSYVSFADTSLNGMECEYTTDDKGIITSITVEGKKVWSRLPAVTTNPVNQQRGNNSTPTNSDSYRLADTFLPKDVRDKDLPDIDNFALKLQKAARYEPTRDGYKFLFFKNDQRNNIRFEIRANYGHLTDNFDKLYQRQSRQAECLFPNNSTKISLHLQWRMVLGLGGESIYETNMTLHHLYGIPYLPSSSIKGVLRSWMISQFFAQASNVPEYEKDYPLVNAEFRAITESKLFCTIFGCPKDIKRVAFEDDGKPKMRKNKKGEDERVYDDSEASALGWEHQGSAIFFDGIPSIAPVVKTDVMNVHYKDWYKDTNYTAPTDTQRTNPIFFLTVSSDNDLKFQTHIATNKKNTLKEIDGDYLRFLTPDSPLSGDSSLLDFVKHHLTTALTQQGIGAKTAVGYGYMQPTSPT